MFKRFWRRPLPQIWLIVALLLAGFLRFWQLGEMPPGFYHDEAYNGLDALALLRGDTFPQFYEGWELYAQDAHADNPPSPTRWPLFFEGNYGREPVHIYLMGLSIWLFGATPAVVRAVPAAASVLAVWTTYLAARAIFHNQKRELVETVPILAAFALALLFPAVHFSRFGLRAMVFVPVETLAVYFFWRGVNGAGGQGSGDQRSLGAREFVWFAAAGVMLGLGVYIYAAARLFPLLFVGFVLFWFWQDRAALQRFWRPVAVMAGVSFLTAVPILIFFAQYPYFFVFRIAYVANKGKGAVDGKAWLTWLLNIGRTIRGLFWLGETHLRHNLPGRPYLDPVQAFTFVAGLFWALRQKLQLRSVFILLWLIVMLLPTIMSGDAPHFGRMTGAAPVVVILIALGSYHVSRITFHALRLTDNRLRITLYVLLIVASAILTGRDYFGRYANHPQIESDFYLPDWNLGRYAAAQSADTSLFLTPTQEEMATIYFALGSNTARIGSFAESETLTVKGPPDKPTLYLLRPFQTHQLATLQKKFPDLIAGPEQDNFIPVWLSPDAVRPQPQHSVDHSWDGQIGLLGWSEAVDGQNLAITLFWQAQADMAMDYTAYIHLLDANGQLVAQLDRQPDGYPTGDWRPGEIILDVFVVEMPPGEYRLQTGFYYLPTLEPLGTAVTLDKIAR
jgi:4-amino-4-deoxy-L-arabinose transferase-like glycosyltransferase